MDAITAFLQTVHPYDTLSQDELARVAGSFGRRDYAAAETVYRTGEPLPGLFLVMTGGIEVRDPAGTLVSLLGPRNSFGERGLLRDGLAVTTATAGEASTVLILPLSEFRRLLAESPAFERFFNRGRSPESRAADVTTRRVRELMAATPVTLPPDATLAEAARLMRDRHVSSVGVVEGERFLGIVTTRDMAHKVVAGGMDAGLPVTAAMTRDPVSLPPGALGSDVLHVMLERRVGHLPVVEDGRLVGMVTQTDLTRFQAVSTAVLVRDAAGAADVAELAAVTARIPALLVQLVGGNNAHEVVTRLITDVGDTVTRRLIALYEAEAGAAPVPWAWLACGSQGRQEQTGVSDQDNCLFIDDSATDDDLRWFEGLARFVCDGLNACGYVYCPGEMMATTPRWRQRMGVWRDYFHGWIARPDPMAQMLSSVMFDLRPVGGTVSLHADLQEETLQLAAKNSIFTAHMIANSLKHTPPLGLLRGFATIRSGEHKNAIDLKMNGVVPIVDLGRIYALIAEIEQVNTRARLSEATARGIVSGSGGQDLLAAYDLIAETRLQHQARRARAGLRPDNYLAPSDLPDFDRSHLRDAFVVVRTMQSAIGSARGARG